jgi:hypothetical protein
MSAIRHLSSSLTRPSITVRLAQVLERDGRDSFFGADIAGGDGTMSQSWASEPMHLHCRASPRSAALLRSRMISATRVAVQKSASFARAASPKCGVLNQSHTIAPAQAGARPVKVR